MKSLKFTLSSVQIIMLSFLACILLGSVLLALPISSATGEPVSYIDALFTATTSTCVTGLVTLPTFSTWSLFGQIVILLLIQIGGLGVITILSGLMMLINRKFGISDGLLIQDALNLSSLDGLKKFVGKVFLGTLIVETIGALLYMPVFIKDFGARGIWISFFNSISAFCNAGIDIVAEDSLVKYATNPIVNITTSLLIILGGIGYIVWWDVIRVASFKNKKLKRFRTLTLHSKIAIVSTLFLIIIGALLIFIFEYNNPKTIGNLNIFDKLQVSLFQSITTRTAGFATVPQENFNNASSLISIILMFIGGSPAGTAGGIKTITFVILFASAFATITNKNDVTLFNREITKSAVNKALAVFSMSFAIMFVSTVLLSLTIDTDLLNILYETVSATATVGLTKGITPELNNWGKIIIILTMYLGRVGPISLALALNSKRKIRNIIKNPTEDISVG